MYSKPPLYSNPAALHPREHRRRSTPTSLHDIIATAGAPNISPNQRRCHQRARPATPYHRHSTLPALAEAPAGQEDGESRVFQRKRQHCHPTPSTLAEVSEAQKVGVGLALLGWKQQGDKEGQAWYS